MAEINDKEKREKRFKDNKKSHVSFNNSEGKAVSYRKIKLREEILNDKRLNKYKKFFDIEEDVEDTEGDEGMFFQ